MKNNLLLILFVGMFLIAFTQKNKVNENIRYEYLMLKDLNDSSVELFSEFTKKFESQKTQRKENIQALIIRILNEKSQAGWELCETTTITSNSGSYYYHTTYILRKPITN